MIHVIIGTKAQLIKTAPVLAELKKRKIPFNFIFTGQHKETMIELRKIFDIKKPDYILYKGKDITSIGQMVIWATRILWLTLKKKKEIFKNDSQGIVLVHGDTFSTLLGALMGKISRLKVGHIESGLRSFNLWHPFPEEITRLLVFRMSDVYFCPGAWAVKNLKKYKSQKINTEANTLLDALNLALKNESKIKVDIPQEKYCLVSVHRFENIFNRSQFEKIIKIIEKTALKMRVLIIMHPPTEKNLHKFGFYKRLKKNKNIELRPRYDYFQFIKLVNNSEFLMTDGGSNQEESFYLGHPCLILREATERKEGLKTNVVLSKFNQKVIDKFINNPKHYQKKQVVFKISPSQKIVDFCRNYI